MRKKLLCSIFALLLIVSASVYAGFDVSYQFNKLNAIDNPTHSWWLLIDNQYCSTQPLFGFICLSKQIDVNYQDQYDHDGNLDISRPFDQNIQSVYNKTKKIIIVNNTQYYYMDSFVEAHYSIQSDTHFYYCNKRWPVTKSTAVSVENTMDRDGTMVCQ